MSEFKYLHLCNHTFKQGNKDGIIKELDIRNDGKSLTDVLIQGAVVLEIMGVQVTKYIPIQNIAEFEYDNDVVLQTYEDVDAEDSFYDDEDGFIVDYSNFFQEGAVVSSVLPQEFYEPFLHNRIKWKVKPPTEYRIKLRMLFTNGQTITHKPAECSRCQGKGWFIDILNNEGTFEIAVGVNKIAQRVIKDLLTKIQTNRFDLGYGTMLYMRLQEKSTDDERMFDDIRLIVSEVEDNYLTKQSERFGDLSSDETLVSLRVQNITRSKMNPTLISIELGIQTEAGFDTIRIAV